MDLRKRILIALLTLFMPELAFYYVGRSLRSSVVLGAIVCILKILISCILGYFFSWKLTLIIVTGSFLLLAIFLVILVQRSATRLQSHPFKSRTMAFVFLIGVTFQFTAFYAKNISYLPKYRTFYVPSESMYPTVFAGDRIVADLIKSRDAPISLGDVVVFKRKANQVIYVKRVVGMGLDTIQVTNDLVELQEISEVILSSQDSDNIQLNQISFAQRRYSIATTYNDPLYTMHGTRNWPRTGPHLVPSHHFFVLGDNRSRSVDSRNYGDIGRDELIGKVLGVSYHFSTAKLTLFSRILHDLK